MLIYDRVLLVCMHIGMYLLVTPSLYTGKDLVNYKSTVTSIERYSYVPGLINSYPFQLLFPFVKARIFKDEQYNPTELLMLKPWSASIKYLQVQ